MHDDIVVELQIRIRVLLFSKKNLFFVAYKCPKIRKRTISFNLKLTCCHQGAASRGGVCFDSGCCRTPESDHPRVTCQRKWVAAALAESELTDYICQGAEFIENYL